MKVREKILNFLPYKTRISLVKALISKYFQTLLSIPLEKHSGGHKTPLTGNPEKSNFKSWLKAMQVKQYLRNESFSS